MTTPATSAEKIRERSERERSRTGATAIPAAVTQTAAVKRVHGSAAGRRQKRSASE
jgi:hypothetical protein